MREIKFRAWHKPFKKTKFGSEFVYGAKAFDFWIISPDDYTLEQYAGLHDKNGKEIYEGDIVEWNDFGNKRVGYVTFSPDIEFVTANHDYNFGDFAYQDTKEYLTIIGNIHENPELLEVVDGK